MIDFTNARLHMIECQLRPNRISDDRVVDAFMRLSRELFVPERQRAVAYVDRNLPLGNGRYLMQPMVAGRLLQAAQPGPKDIALVVGAGVGYEAALLSMLARYVVALEEDDGLARIGRSALVEHNIGSVTFVESPLRAGWRQRAPYNIILFGGAVAEIPAEIESQLAEGGRLVVVLQQQERVGRATLVTRTGGVLAQRVIFDATTPLLPGFAAKPAFVF